MLLFIFLSGFLESNHLGPSPIAFSLDFLGFKPLGSIAPLLTLIGHFDFDQVTSTLDSASWESSLFILRIL